jgi:hypothetical protein
VYIVPYLLVLDLLDYPNLLFSACCCPARAQLRCVAEAQRSAACR